MGPHNLTKRIAVATRDQIPQRKNHYLPNTRSHGVRPGKKRLPSPLFLSLSLSLSLVRFRVRHLEQAIDLLKEILIIHDLKRSESAKFQDRLVNAQRSPKE